VEEYVEARGLTDRVVVVGAQDHVEEWLAASDVFVLTSFNEGLANAMLEAMASALPVVSSPVSGAHELVTESGGGVVVDITDRAAFADAIARLTEDADLRRRLGQRGRCVIEQRYSLSTVAARYEALYTRLCDIERAA
jgi:glycosyltransferase involved in cell wall biosynthesis